jgi:hypothetical protein
MSSPFSSAFVRNLTPKTPNPAVSKSLPAMPAAVVSAAGGSTKRYNPFLSALDNDSVEFKEVYGVNKPLSKPMFLGYRDDKPVFGGSRLFILY